MDSTIRTADARTIHTWDSLVLFWAVLWAVLGVLTGVTVWQVADAGDTLSSSGHTLTSIGKTLESLSGVPVIGERPGQIGAQVVDSATEIAERGQKVKGELRRMAVLLGIAIMGIPVTPVVGLYLPLRLSRRREIAGLRTEVAARPDDEGLDRYLAEQARLTLPYASIASITTDPVADLGPADLRRLADAELGRLGVARPAQG